MPLKEPPTTKSWLAPSVMSAMALALNDGALTIPGILGAHTILTPAESTGPRVGVATVA